MENLIISYALKASVAIILLYGLYALSFRKDTFNKTKRFYLLFIILFSLLYPFCKLNISATSDIVIYQAILPQIEITENTSPGSQLFTMRLIGLLLLISISGIVILFFRFLLQLSGVLNLRLKNGYQNIGNYKIINLDETIIPFSFFRWIFVPYDSFEEEDLGLMVEHEKQHANQHHSLDILLCELFCILFWWNPIVWLLKREMKINLEYLADEGVLNKGIEAKKYQYLLLQVIKPNINMQIVNNFNVSQLRKRITMINKKKTSGFMSVKYLLALPVVTFMLVGNAQNTFSKQKEKITVTSLSESTATSQDELFPFVSVEIMPQYPGGDNALMDYISTNIKYPEEAVRDNVQGRVVIRFVVSKTGTIKDVTIIRSLDPRCDEEAKRVVEGMTKWIPGKQNSKVVDVYYTLPILFKMKK